MAQQPTPLAQKIRASLPGGAVGKIVKGAQRVYLVTEDELEGLPDVEKESASAAAERVRVEAERVRVEAERVRVEAEKALAQERASAHKDLDEVIDKLPLWGKVKPAKASELVIVNNSEYATLANLRLAIITQTAKYVGKFNSDLSKRVRK